MSHRADIRVEERSRSYVSNFLCLMRCNFGLNKIAKNTTSRCAMVIAARAALDFVFPSILFARKSASLPVRVPTIVSLLLLLPAQVLAACTLLFAMVAVTASGQFLSFDYMGPMSGTLGKASRLTSSARSKPGRLTYLFWQVKVKGPARTSNVEPGIAHRVLPNCMLAAPRWPR